MNRRALLGATVAASVSGCLSWLRGGRECPELDGVEGDTICSNDGSLFLEIEPRNVELPATVTFTIVNERDRDVSFHTEYPLVYRDTGSDWEQDQYVRWNRSPTPTEVTDRRSFEMAVPFADSWEPEPGEYLVLLPGWLGDPDTPVETVAVGEFVGIEP
ncbi:hypothetical protein BRC81_02175 [Halobacteriales archaeon QS_1_68_20]|nr:MAG: hypothetical protein BRC81_02175 [Halobacteriales archaeon QS_1_68_20]